jgi:hypothetical protein
MPKSLQSARLRVEHLVVGTADTDRRLSEGALRPGSRRKLPGSRTQDERPLRRGRPNSTFQGSQVSLDRRPLIDGGLDMGASEAHSFCSLWQ